MSKKLLPIEKGVCRSHFSSARHTNVECELHLHFHMEIVIVTSGILNMIVGTKEHEIRAHQGIFIPPLIPHAFLSKIPNRCNILMFSEELVPSFFDYYQGHTISIIPFEISDESYTLTERNMPNQLNHSDLLTAQATVFPLCLEIAKQCGNTDQVQPASDLFIEALHYISLHYSEDLSLTKVAQAIGVHPVTLSKRFSNYSKLNFSTYLKYLRCTHAAEIIRTNKISIAEAAFSVGFNTIRSFNMAFKETFGVTPSAYKKSPSSYYHL